MHITERTDEYLANRADRISEFADMAMTAGARLFTDWCKAKAEGRTEEADRLQAEYRMMKDGLNEGN